MEKAAGKAVSKAADRQAGKAVALAVAKGADNPADKAAAEGQKEEVQTQAAEGQKAEAAEGQKVAVAADLPGTCQGEGAGMILAAIHAEAAEITSPDVEVGTIALVAIHAEAAAKTTLAAIPEEAAETAIRVATLDGGVERTILVAIHAEAAEKTSLAETRGGAAEKLTHGEEALAEEAQRALLTNDTDGIEIWFAPFCNIMFITFQCGYNFGVCGTLAAASSLRV